MVLHGIISKIQNELNYALSHSYVGLVCAYKPTIKNSAFSKFDNNFEARDFLDIFFLNISDIEAFVSHLTKLILEEGCRYFCENECQSSIPITGSELKGCFRLI